MVHPSEHWALLVDQAHLVRRQMFLHRSLGREMPEVALTANLINELVQRGRGRVSATPAPAPESRYGADLELWLRGGGVLLGLRLQAKILKPGGPRSAARYAELHHKIGKQQIPQVSQLIANTPASMTPGYLFYNAIHQRPVVTSACCSHDGYKRRFGRYGLTITSAQTVQKFSNAAPRPLAELGDVLPQCVPLQCLALCPAQYLGERRNYPLPLQAASLPIRLVGGGRPTVVRDRSGELTDEVRLALRHVDVDFDDDKSAPEYVYTLITQGNIDQGAEPTARFVVVMDGDAS
jgi:hypothetical protein